MTEKHWMIYTANPSSVEPPMIYFQAGHTSKEGYTRYEHFVTGKRKNFIDDVVGSTRDKDEVKEAIEEYIEFHENRAEKAREYFEDL